jgi:CBF/Mak21 family
VPLIYKLLKRHPGCMVLIHRAEAPAAETWDDRYDPKEADPYKSNAEKSSLWEVMALREHYHPSVAILAKVFETVFTRPEYQMEDFLDHSYATVKIFQFPPGYELNSFARFPPWFLNFLLSYPQKFDQEMSRKPKVLKAPPLALEKPRYLFSKARDVSEAQNSWDKIWRF